MAVSEKGHTVCDLRSHTVYRHQFLYKTVVRQVLHAFDIDLSVLRALCQLYETALPEPQSAFADALLPVEDLFGCRERSAGSEVGAEMVAYGLYHLGYALYVDVRRKDVCRKAFPFGLTKYTHTGTVGRQAGNIAVAPGDLFDYLPQIVLRTEISEDLAHVGCTFAVESVGCLCQGDHIVADDALPRPVFLFFPAVCLPASQGRIEGDVHFHVHDISTSQCIFITYFTSPCRRWPLHHRSQR